MKKAAYGISRAANVLWGVLHDILLDDFFEGVFHRMNADLTNATELSALAIFHSLLKVICSVDNSTCTQDDPIPVSPDSDSSSCGQNGENGDFQSASVTQQCGHNVVTQVSISHTIHSAPRDLNIPNAHNIHQLPTIVYRTFHEEENIEDFLQRNAQIIDDYVDNTEDNSGQCQDEDSISAPSQCSWVMVPQNSNAGAITMLSNAFQAEEESGKMEYMHNNLSFECCVVCQEPFQDGDRLLVLPCQHMFHCGCVTKFTSEEDLSRCPLCTKFPSDAPQVEISDKYAKEP
jgi:hypothetical protein